MNLINTNKNKKMKIDLFNFNNYKISLMDIKLNNSMIFQI